MRILLILSVSFAGCHIDRYSYKDCDERFLQPPPMEEEMLLKRYLETRSLATIDSFFAKWLEESKSFSVDTSTYNVDQLTSYNLTVSLINDFIAKSRVKYPYFVYDGRVKLEIVDSIYRVIIDSNLSNTLRYDSIRFNLSKLCSSTKPLFLDQKHERLLNRFFCSNSFAETLKKRNLFDSLIYVFPNLYRVNEWQLESPPRNIQITLSESRLHARVFYGSWSKAGGWKTLRKISGLWTIEEDISWVE